MHGANLPFPTFFGVHVFRRAGGKFNGLTSPIHIGGQRLICPTRPIGTGSYHIQLTPTLALVLVIKAEDIRRVGFQYAVEIALVVHAGRLGGIAFVNGGLKFDTHAAVFTATGHNIRVVAPRDRSTLLQIAVDKKRRFLNGYGAGHGCHAFCCCGDRRSTNRYARHLAAIDGRNIRIARGPRNGRHRRPCRRSGNRQFDLFAHLDRSGSFVQRDAGSRCRFLDKFEIVVVYRARAGSAGILHMLQFPLPVFVSIHIFRRAGRELDRHSGPLGCGQPFLRRPTGPVGTGSGNTQATKALPLVLVIKAEEVSRIGLQDAVKRSFVVNAGVHRRSSLSYLGSDLQTAAAVLAVAFGNRSRSIRSPTCTALLKVTVRQQILIRRDSGQHQAGDRAGKQQSRCQNPRQDPTCAVFHSISSFSVRKKTGNAINAPPTPILSNAISLSL